jgi:hypothetical protein
MSIVKLGHRHVGWRTEDGVVASVRLERDGDELVVATLDYDDVTAARSLFDAVGAVATARRLVGADDRLAQLGFAAEGVRWVRPVEVAPSDAPAPVTLARLEEAIRASWDRETTEEPDVWTEENPAYGNCAVTALVVRDYLGGDVVAAGVVRGGARVDRHAWNRLPSGLEVDLSRDQFRDGEQYEDAAVVTEFVGARTQERYELLAARVRERLGR